MRSWKVCVTVCALAESDEQRQQEETKQCLHKWEILVQGVSDIVTPGSRGGWLLLGGQRELFDARLIDADVEPVASRTT